VRIYQYIMPVTQMRGRIAPLRRGDAPPKIPTICGHLWVPMDDVTTAVYNFIYSYDAATPMTPEFAMQNEVADGRGPDELLPDFRLKRNMANDYLIDREIQRNRSFTGIAGVNTQDVALQEGMGRILDRSKEHLGSTDRAITTMRQLMLEATYQVEAGQMPRGAHPETYRGVRAVDHLIPEGQDWREALKEELRARF
jgi:phthalate 4,5-dioxygenase